MSRLLARVAGPATLSHVRHVAPVPPRAAQGLVAAVYQQVARDFGMLAPPVILHSPAPPALAACWVMLRETLVATGLASRRTKEAVAAAVSLANTCPYCVDVHTAALMGLAPGPDAAAVAADRIRDVADPVLRAVLAWARASPGAGPARAGLAFPPEQAPELIGVAVTFHYLNRMVNVFLPPSPIPPGTPAALRRPIMRVAARMFGSLARPSRRPGESRDLLAAAPLPPDMSWAAAGADVSDAMARASAAIEAGGQRVVPARARELVLARLATWSGEPVGLAAHAWANDTAAILPRQERPAARLALLVAFSSYQVTGASLDDLRALGHGDDALIELTSWASLAAARRVGVLLSPPA